MSEKRLNNCIPLHTHKHFLTCLISSRLHGKRKRYVFWFIFTIIGMCGVCNDNEHICNSCPPPPNYEVAEPSLFTNLPAVSEIGNERCSKGVASMVKSIQMPSRVNRLATVTSTPNPTPYSYAVILYQKNVWTLNA